MEESIKMKIAIDVLRETEQFKFYQNNYNSSNDAFYDQGAKDFAHYQDNTSACKYYLLCNGYR